MTKVLLVAKDVGLGTALANELELAGHEVMWCPGPRRPDYVCRAGLPGRCPLTTDVDVAVVDGWLASDEHRAGIPSWHLVRYYRGFGLPVVALVGPDGWATVRRDRRVIALPRESDAEDVANAVERLLDREMSPPR